MELNMRYATTADGVSIAYAVAGQGAPLVRVPNPPFSHVQLEWREGTFFDRLGRGRMLITFDPRGTGMSDRDVTDYSLDARLLDIEAVVDSIPLPAFALHGVWHSGPLVIEYAARHLERVSHLILDDAFADGRAISRTPAGRALSQLAGDWEAVTESIAFTFAGAGGDDARRYAKFMQGCTTHDAARRMWAAFAQVDVTERLPQIKAPTLILQHSGFRGFADHARLMATLIPNARVVMLGGKEVDSLDVLLSATSEFLGDEAASLEPTARPSAFRTVLFTDIVGHTEMMQRLGDAKGRDVLREHERITRDLLKQHGGAEVKTMGDGFLASFGSVTSAMECAIALQRAFAAHTESTPEPLHVRVGLNAGEPIEEDGDLFGSTVILASRIAAQAGAGEILVPDTVRGLSSGKGFVFGDRGEFVPKGFDDAVRLFELRWQP
jgi:class 3 adenylate cyclase/pimeloyl-ACP methyl ester carboxylesterase